MGQGVVWWYVGGGAVGMRREQAEASHIADMASASCDGADVSLSVLELCQDAVGLTYT